MKDMFGCRIFDKVEYFRRKKNNVTMAMNIHIKGYKWQFMAMYIHIRGYKTRQNQKDHNMHSKARLKTLEMVRCWCIDVELYKNVCAK